MNSFGSDPACPCGSGLTLSACCGPLLRGEPAGTAEQLMRSRYTAYALGAHDHLFRSWHPRTRPAQIALSPDTRWLGLTVLGGSAGGVTDQTGIVEFEARYDDGDGPRVLHERSRFERRGPRWVYRDAVAEHSPEEETR